MSEMSALDHDNKELQASIEELQVNDVSQAVVDTGPVCGSLLLFFKPIITMHYLGWSFAEFQKIRKSESVSS